MSVDFSPPSYRAGSSDLAISISPLGLVELADEEFEVHGPRLNRYSLNWAMYLGQHWSYRRETGETQLTVNFVRAFTDYIINFCTSRGVHFHSPKETEAIVPDLLKRVWEVDNDKRTVMTELFQQGGVSGDVFMKVAYEEPWVDTAGMSHVGRVRLLVLNPAHCFPEWHPHDKTRLVRFKLKYKFWGTSLEGTRQVYTYTEILTDDSIEEYVNDECISQRENPLGTIPVKHCANRTVSGSPWGLADCHDVIGLNRHYNEVSTDIADIINYHAAPVTVITGAKANQLEKGPKKVWGGLPKEAKVFNLELGENLASPLEYLDRIKRHMHEMVGVPETALGQVQPISNTSGVALSIQFQPLMNVWGQKIGQYGLMLEQVNELVLKTLALKEPETFIWDPDTDVPLKEDQYPQLDPADPLTYQTYTFFPPPLPIDKLIVLNEVQLMLGLGLQSREGALRSLGEEFPDEKLLEIRRELLEDAKADGALQLLKSTIEAEIMQLTGVMPVPGGPSQMPPTNTEQNSAGAKSEVPQMPAPPVDIAGMLDLEGEENLRTQLVTEAYGTKIPQRRAPASGND